MCTHANAGLGNPSVEGRDEKKGREGEAGGKGIDGAGMCLSACLSVSVSVSFFKLSMSGVSSRNSFN